MTSRSLYFAFALGIATAAPAMAQTAVPLPGGSHLGGLLVFHGHYCGPGNDGYDKRPVDALDAACRRHDLCSPNVGLATCGCNGHLIRDADAISRDPGQSADVQALADVVSAGMRMVPCTD